MPNKPEPHNDDGLEKILKKLYSHHLKLVAYLLDNRAPDPEFSEAVMLSEAKDAINKHYIKRSELYKDPRYLALKVQIGQLEAELAPYRAFRAAIKESSDDRHQSS